MQALERKKGRPRRSGSMLDMIVLDCEQGSRAWIEARLGHPDRLQLRAHRDARRQDQRPARGIHGVALVGVGFGGDRG